jgi:hypothetical protein
MAYITEIKCTICGETKRECLYPDNPNICDSCRNKEYSKAKRLYLASLKGLTIEERLSKIEEDLYDLNINQRLSSLESNFIQY